MSKLQSRIKAPHIAGSWGDKLITTNIEQLKMVPTKKIQSRNFSHDHLW
jgi:hypothetical protein